MTKSERMKERWKDPEFRKKHAEAIKNRRPRGEVKAEKAEKARRKAVRKEHQEMKAKAREEKKRKKEVVEKYIKDTSSKRVEMNNSWRTCLCCDKILPINMIVDKRFNICIDCK